MVYNWITRLLVPGVTAAAPVAFRGSVHLHEEGRMSNASTRPVRVAVVVGCLLVSAASGCSSRSPEGASTTPASSSTVALLPAASAVQGEKIPGIGATRAEWDDSHTPNTAAANGYGHDPSLPQYLAPNGAVYSDVSDLGTGRIQVYALNMHTVDRFAVLRRVWQELPSDAAFAWDLMRDRCYRVAFNSPTLQAAGDFMAEVQLQYIQADGRKATSSDRFNQAVFWLDGAGSPPDTANGCGQP